METKIGNSTFGIASGALNAYWLSSGMEMHRHREALDHGLASYTTQKIEVELVRKHHRPTHNAVSQLVSL